MAAWFQAEGSSTVFPVFAEADGRFPMNRFANLLNSTESSIGISGIPMPCSSDGKSFGTLDELRRIAEMLNIDEDGSLSKPFKISICVQKPHKFKATDDISSPSLAANADLKATLDRSYFNDFRTKRGLPIGIFVKAFAKFRELFKQADVGDHEWVLAEGLVMEMPKSYPEEKFRQDAFVKLLSDYLTATTGDMFEVVSNIQNGPDKARPGVSVPDVKVYARWGSVRLVVSLIEVKNEVGFSGEPCVHNTIYYAKLVSEAAGTPYYYLGYPQLLMELVGPHFRVGGAVFHDKATYEPMTAYMPLLNLHDPDNVWQLARLSVAIRTTLCELRSLYSNAASRPKALICEQALQWPYRLQELYPEASLERIGNRPLYRVLQTNQPDVYVKFVQGRYGFEAHKQWADLGYAPRFTQELLPDNWIMITMEGLAANEGWRRLCDLDADHSFIQNWSAWKPAVFRALEVVQAHQPVMVHGDLRGPNIVINLNTGLVKFLDFDWAGVAGVARYPPLLNKQIVWPAGVKGNAIILPAHDKEMVAYELQRLSGRF